MFDGAHEVDTLCLTCTQRVSKRRLEGMQGNEASTHTDRTSMSQVLRQDQYRSATILIVFPGLRFAFDFSYSFASTAYKVYSSSLVGLNNSDCMIVVLLGLNDAGISVA